MSTAYISAFDNVDYDGFGRGAQCFDGFCSQDRVTVTATTSFPGSPQMTVQTGTNYVAVYLSAPGLVYAGPAPFVANRAQALPAGWWPMTVNAGDVLFIRDL